MGNNRLVKCPKCNKPTIRCHGEGYDTKAAEHQEFTLGRICKHCGLIYLNIGLREEYTIEWSPVGS